MKRYCMVLPMVYPNGQGKNTSYSLHHVHIFLKTHHLERHNPAIPYVFPLIVKHREHPHFAALQPDKFICIENSSFTIQTGEVASIFHDLVSFQARKEEHYPRVHPCIDLPVFLKSIHLFIIKLFKVFLNRSKRNLHTI